MRTNTSQGQQGAGLTPLPGAARAGGASRGTLLGVTAGTGVEHHTGSHFPPSHTDLGTGEGAAPALFPDGSLPLELSFPTHALPRLGNSPGHQTTSVPELTTLSSGHLPN